MCVNCVKEFLQFLGCQDSIGEVGFEFIKGQFSIIWEESMKDNKTVRTATSFQVKWRSL